MTTRNDALGEISAAGVAVWLDDISRDRLGSGNLAALMADRHLVGVTSNPTIFEHALSHGDAYDDQIADLALRGVSTEEAVRSITTFDIRWAADVLRPAYDASGGQDGRVSLEVDPRLAHDTDKTVAEARALWWTVDRANLYIKVPATREGLPAITRCLAEGISVNVTLIFALDRYREVIEAHMTGLQQAAEVGRDLSQIASVASFFVSRVDTEVDNRLDKLGTAAAKDLRGKAAIANARLAYELFEQRRDTDRWQALEDRGARVQRPLWASTSTKDPDFRDTMYVEELVAPDTVNTMPEPTLHAMADHGDFRGDTIHGNYDAAREELAALERLGVSYQDVVRVLEEEGVRKFANSWNELLDAVTSELSAARQQ